MPRTATIKAMAATAQIAWDWASALLSPSLDGSFLSVEIVVLLSILGTHGRSSITVHLPDQPRNGRPLRPQIVTRPGWGIGRLSAPPELKPASGLIPMPASTPPSSKDLIASSAGWVAVLLNLVPGLGTGYIYQRRWKAYWICSLITTSWFVLGAVLAGEATLRQNNRTNGSAWPVCCW